MVRVNVPKHQQQVRGESMTFKKDPNYPPGEPGKDDPNGKPPRRPSPPGSFRVIADIPPPQSSDPKAVLFREGTRLAVADGNQLRVYELTEHEEGLRAKLLWLARSEVAFTHATALDRERVAVVMRQREGSHLAVAHEGRLYTIGKLPGRVQEIAAAGRTVFTTVAATAESAAQLIGIDWMTGLRVASYPVQTANLNLAVSPDASLLVATDRSSGQVHGIPVTRTCEGGIGLPPADPPQPRPEVPDPHHPGGGYNGCGCGCRCKPDRPDHPGTPTGPPDSSVPLPDPNPPGPGRRPCGPGSVTLPQPCGKVIAVGSRLHYVPCTPTEPECDAGLDFPIGSLVRAGRFLLARSQNARRLALLDSNTLRVVGQRSLPPEGALLASAPDTERIVAFNGGSETWEALDLGVLPGAANPIAKVSIAADTSEITFVGRNNLQVPRSAQALQGERRVLMVPIVDNGQSYSEANVDKVGLFTYDNVFEEYKAYYTEASYDNLDMKFDFMGYTAWAPGKPIELPRKMRSYFYPPFEPGGLRATENLGAGSHDLYLDGSESMNLIIHPIEGAETAISVPTFAFAAAAAYDAFPTVSFAGAESADMTATLGNGSTFNLAVQFPAASFAFSEATLATRLNELSEYLLDAIAAAENAAGVPGGGQRVTAVECRRVRRKDQQFGELHVNIRFSASNAGKARLNLSAQNGLEKIGFNNVLRGQFTIPGDEADMAAYWKRTLEDAQADAGFQLDNYQIADATVGYSSNLLTTDFLLADEYGGKNANIRRDGTPAGLNHLGFNDAQAIDGSDTNRDDANALRDSQDMLNDVITAVLDRIGGPGEVNQLAPYSSIFFAFILAPPAGLPAGTNWSTSAPDVAGLRMFARNMTAEYKPNKDIQVQSLFIGTLLGDLAQNATAIHELGHSIGYADQYPQAGYRDDLLYLEDWDFMDHSGSKSHPGGYHKMVSGWIPESRIVKVPRPSSTGPVTREALLVPVEFWDDGMEAAVQAAAPPGAPGIRQLMRIDLGGDGAQFGLIEARQRGIRFSQTLPAEPALLITNCLDKEDDTRYSKNNKFRRQVHRLTPHNALTTTGDSFNLAAAPELPAKGVSVEIAGEFDVARPYGMVHVFHVRARVEQADYIDLTFTDHVPNWQSPDIWVDFQGDNDDPAVPRLYPEGEPLDQGETVRPGEDHFVVARVWNKGKGEVTAENVKVRLEIKSPAGGGDAAFQKHSSVVIPSVANGDWEPAIFNWTPPADEDHHLCLRSVIEDWEIPVDSGGEALASDDVWVSNNWAQQNVFEFTSASGSPFDPITFRFSVSNTGIEPERAFLEPEFLPRGMRLRVTPRSRIIAPGATAIFHCTLTLDEQIIRTGCQNDRSFMLYALRQTAHDLVRWGGCKYVIQPRRRTETTLSGMWSHNFLTLEGAVVPAPGAGPVRLRMRFADNPPQWVTVDMEAGGTFSLEQTTNFPAGTELRVLAHFEGNQEFAASKSKEILLANAVVG